MQKRGINSTTKLYIIVSLTIILLAALTIALYFTMGARSTNGTKTGTNNGSVEQLTAQVLVGDTATSTITPVTLISGDTTNLTSSITIKNNSNIAAYTRAKVTLAYVDSNGDISNSTSSVGLLFGYDDSNWTYAADNYLYYKNILASSAATSSLVTSITGYSTDGVGQQVGIFITAEIIQKEAAEPDVTISGSGITETTASFSQGLMNSTYSFTALSSETAERTVTITNTGKLDLDIKLRIEDSEWTVSGATIGGSDVDVERDANSGYYKVIGKLEAGSSQTCVITFIDANRNNDIVADATTVSFIFQDYVVANDFYSMVDSDLQNIMSFENGAVTVTISDTTKTQLTSAKIYSYNNVDKYVYIKTVVSTGEVAEYGSDWGFIQGEQTAISGTAIAPKSTSSLIYDSDWINSLTAGNTLTISVWSAITVEDPTISLIQQSSLSDVDTYYQPVTATGATLTSTDLIIDASSTITASTITSAWGDLAVKSTDYSDLLVRVSMALTWGTNSSGSWVEDAPQPSVDGLDLSEYYGSGFSYNSEDSSITYSYNLAQGQATSPILEFPDDISTLVNAINNTSSSTSGSIKLTVIVEAIYAVGSQLDVIDMSSASSIALDNYYLDVEGYTSMVQTEGIITYDPSDSSSIDWDKYSIYATNNFPLGVRVAVALQWGTLSGTTWTASTTDSTSEISLDSYINTNYWTFDLDLGGYQYNYSVPGKSATKAIFDLTAVDDEGLSLQDAIDAEASVSHSGEIVRLVIVVETTYKV